MNMHRFLRIHFCLTLALGGALLGWAASNYTTPYTFTNLAGTPSIGSDDGTGNAARFNRPCGVAADSAGNLYVADKDNFTIRRITPTGIVTTIAGAPGFDGYVDGNGSAARFRLPVGVAVDANGTLYVADMGNYVIRKITTAGVVSTLAGSGNPGSADGTGTAAQFNVPTGIAVGPGGDLYVTDIDNKTIRKVTAAGVVTTFAGTAGVAGSADGTGATASFSAPSSITTDGAGNLFVTDGYTVRKITASGVVTTIAGTAGQSGTADGNGSGAAFAAAIGITIDATGNLYIADWSIRKITPAGDVTTIAGNHGNPGGSSDGAGAAAQFNNPAGIAADATGNLFVCDRDNNTVRKITSAGAVTTFAGLPPEGSRGNVDGAGVVARFNSPAGVAVAPNGDVYIADSGNRTIRRITAAGATSTVTGTSNGQSNPLTFDNPAGLAIDLTGNLYVGQAGNNIISKVTPAGVVTTFAGAGPRPGHSDGTGTDATFFDPEGLAVDANGTVYVADRGNHTIRRISSAGVVTTLAGSAGVPGSADGTGSSARFYESTGVVVDANGNVFVADGLNNAVRKISPTGVVTTIAGVAGTDGNSDGVGTAARFWVPTSVAVDAAGNVFVTDSANQTVRKITPDGTVSTIAGFAETSGSASGTGQFARFDNPRGIAINASGTLYVTNSDGASNTVVAGVAAGRPVITAQPAGISVAAGGNVQFSVTASGDPAPNYQWQFNGSAVGGATLASLSLTSVQSANAGDYTVVVSNSLGSVTSAKATLTVTTTPTTPSTPATPSTPSSGGGGSLSGWFVGILVVLWCLRRLFAPHRGIESAAATGSSISIYFTTRRIA
ncbi:MAG TPA: immunoglobulin domain-containing protein [Lacunisphaera sp.]|jgi:sugar lactone lactonase YvrE